MLPSRLTCMLITYTTSSCKVLTAPRCLKPLQMGAKSDVLYKAVQSARIGTCWEKTWSLLSTIYSRVFAPSLRLHLQILTHVTRYSTLRICETEAYLSILSSETMTRQLSSPSTAQPWKQIDKQSPDEVDTSGSSSFMTSNKYRACSTSADQFSDIVDQAFNITTEAYSTNSLLDHYNSNGGAEKPCKPARRTDQVEKSPYQLWLPEISCWVVSFVFFTAIIGILSAYDQRRAPRLPHDISLNTIVSLLATVGTSVLMMTVASGLGQVKWNWFKTQARPMCDFQSIDAASRGPAGSFRLVIKGRGGSAPPKLRIKAKVDGITDVSLL